jgi:hypothetical protein
LSLTRWIAGSYLACTNTRRLRRALAALFGSAVGKDIYSTCLDHRGLDPLIVRRRWNSLAYAAVQSRSSMDRASGPF